MIISSCIQHRNFLKFPCSRKIWTWPQRNVGHQLANQYKRNESTSSLICILKFTLQPRSSFQPLLKSIFLILSHPPLFLVFPLLHMSVCLIGVPHFSEGLFTFLHFFSVLQMHNLYYPSSSLLFLLSAQIYCWAPLENSSFSLLYFSIPELPFCYLCSIFTDVLYLMRWCHHTFLSFLKIWFSLDLWSCL